MAPGQEPDARPGGIPDEGKPGDSQRFPDAVRRAVTLATGETGEVVVLLRPSRTFFPRGGPALPLLLFLPVAILVAGAGGIILFRTFTRRLRALEHLATRVTEGDLDARIQDLGTDEIARLGARLNRMTEAIGEAQRRIEANDRQRRQLFADITHDLATPLTSIRGYAETLLNPGIETTEDERRAYLQNIVEESKRLDALIKDMFELARLEADAVTLSLEPLDWAALCRHTTERFTPRFREAGLRLEWAEVAGEAWVEGDGRRLEQVLENLLTNALRYVPAGGRVLLRLEAGPDHGFHRLTVSDDGPGFAPEDLPHVFDRFYRGDAARSGSGGTGLGLAIVQEIVLRHRGEIRAENLAGGGAAIRVELPTRPTGA
jgi:signal transduction histidine kinase